jgi:3-phenylpropionate/cinnamic acid dioxygenase small subunit
VGPEQISIVNRLEIDDLLTLYATAIDSLNFELLDTVFSADAHLDYRSAGGIEGPYPEVRKWLSEVLPIFDATQHLVVNRVFKADEGEVQTTSSFLNTNRLKVDGKPWTFTVGGRYRDRFVNGPDGWRIARRVEDTLWWDNPMPGLPESPFTVLD